MSAERINQTLTLNDGRCLGFAEYGIADGRPIFHTHGSASSRFERPSSEDLLTQLRIRFISTDRPGHGLSDYHPDRRLLDWPGDIGQLADHLGINQFYVTGYSAGGPHALACAHHLPECVIAGAVISGIAPMSRPGVYKGMPLLNQLLARSSRHFPWLTKQIRKLMRHMAMDDVEKTARQVMSSIPDADKSVLYAPENIEIMVSSIREGFVQGSEGVALDDILVNSEWGFNLQDVAPRIDIWHGEADVTVPAHAGEYLKEMLPNNRTIFLPEKGHFFLMETWEQVLSALVSVK